MRSAVYGFRDRAFDARGVLEVLLLVTGLHAHLVDALDGVFYGLVELASLLFGEAVVGIVLQAVDEFVPCSTDEVDVVHVVWEDEVGLFDQWVSYLDAFPVGFFGAVGAGGGHGGEDEEDGVEDEHDGGGT